MGETHKLGEDLDYVRSALDRGRIDGSPAAIYWIWAAIIFVGFALVDLAPRTTGPYWLVAAPVGFAASMWFGRRSAERLGEINRAGVRRHLLHWSGLLIAALLALVPVVAGKANGFDFATTMVLLAGLTHWLAGVHGDRPMFVSGTLLFAGYAMVILLPGPAWTVLGVVVGAALALAGWSARRSSGGETQG